jgi:protein involved in ribonucleotide reduction
MSIQIVFFSNYSGNTKRLIEKVGGTAIRIPINWDSSSPLIVSGEYVLVVPTYGGGSERSAIPKQVKSFLNIGQNRSLLRGVIGTGNTNFGDNYCKAAEIISRKTGVPLIAKVEIFGTDADVNKINERLKLLYDNQ